jgi:formylglycine-generating enzyme required for sulfatase activity
MRGRAWSSLIRGVGVALVVLAVSVVVGCSGANLGLSVDGGTQTGDLSGSINESNAPFVILDLTSGDRTTALTVDDLTSNAVYTTERMVFRRVVGLGGSYLLGVFEVTQAQWQRIAPATPQPWTLIDATLVGSAALGDALPAFNLSNDAINFALNVYNTGKVVQLQVPSEAQWELACAAGSSGAWSWGDATDRSTVTTFARVAETSSSQGPQAVGARSPNALGFYDMHGNLWEWSGTGSGAHLHGGSWHDAAVLAKTANALGTAQGVYSDTQHALAGVRLLLRQ